MSRVGSSGITPFLWRADILYSSGFSLLGKLGTSTRRNGNGTFDLCLSMFHVDFDQKTPEKWCHVESEPGARLFRHCAKRFAYSCCCMELSWQRLTCQLLQTLIKVRVMCISINLSRPNHFSFWTMNHFFFVIHIKNCNWRTSCFLIIIQHL